MWTVGSPNRVTPVTTSLTERFDDLNLSVNLPGGSWTKLDPKKTGSRACLLLSRKNPEIILSLAGERAAPNSDNTGGDSAKGALGETPKRK